MLRSKVGPQLAERVSCNVAWDNYTLDFYSVDASPYSLRPCAVVFPKGEKDVISILRFASKNKISVTPRGAGTGLVGGDLGRGIILDMRYFNKIIVRKGLVEVGSGTFKGALDKALSEHGRFLGPNPSIGPFCTIGGMIGTNASGSHSVKYGSIVDNLISVKIITSKGRVLNLPRDSKRIKNLSWLSNKELKGRFPRVSKNSCGYRLEKVASKSEIHKIIAGSEGTLGIVISAKLKTIPLPKRKVLMIGSYGSITQAVIDVPKIIKLGPSALEIIDRTIVSHIREGVPKSAKCLLFIEFDDDVPRKASQAKKVVAGKIISTTDKPEGIAKWWTYRNTALSYSLHSVSKNEILLSSIEDPTVPVHRLPLLLDLISHLKSKYPMKVIIYGHAGNGNLHIRPILRKRDAGLIGKISLEFFSGVISIGGTITGEHGDGISRTRFVKMQYGSEIHSLFRAIKREFDPTNTLNPGKIISRQGLLAESTILSWFPAARPRLR
ncbi:MAG TPA: FAD-binding oxidoreductase [Candidatus Nitrosotalea sp.]|nr:FAD-binding oxidoreductase [Candidatus Nitrosotalea sp.]